jgi:hypothetical protein
MTGNETAPTRTTDAGASTIEVTSAMLDAGVLEYEMFDSADRGSWIVSAIYRAMESVRRRATAIDQSQEPTEAS